MTRIATQHLTLAYNHRVIIDDLNLTVNSGELVGLLGPNGSGKTTVLRALAGVLQPRSGAALIDDQDVRRLSALARARCIGLVPQTEHYAWPLTVEEIVMLGRAPHRGWLLPLSGEDREVVEQVLAFTGLTPLRERPVTKLSGGERQRVVIARALAQGPQVLLLDEPTANLDIHHQFQVLDLVRRLVDSNQLAAVLAIHDLALAARYCDRLVLLHQGHNFAAGKPEDVLTPENLRTVFQVEATLYKAPDNHWALCTQPSG